MKSVIQIEDRYYILASSSLLDERNRVLKHGDTFAVFDRFGDVHAIGGEQGLYHEGTRFLSSYVLTVGGDRPLLLSSTVRDDNATFTADLTNPDVCHGETIDVPHGSLHLFRRKFLLDGTCHEEIRVTNYSMAHLRADLGLQIGGDFVDLFEVRGMKRARRGTLHQPQMQRDGVTLAYDGLDGVRRALNVRTEPAPDRVEGNTLYFSVALDPQQSVKLTVALCCQVGPKARTILPFADARARSKNAIEALRATTCRVHTSNAQFNDWLDRSSADVHLMMTETPHGWYPYAGIPWFSTPIGRDGLISALEYLWIHPGLARGVLSYLAATQATVDDDAMDAEPGKILHEARLGEMAALREIPFGRYYGSVDSTPLFVMLAGAYWVRTADDAFLDALWPAVERAMQWIEVHGDADGDAFVEYARHSADGLVQQGWKDSGDSVFYEDGELAEAPIALCEVQAYVYGAYRAGTLLARRAHRNDLATQWLQRGRHLRRKFEETFWLDDLGTYALALDGKKRPCRVRSSNAGHCLLTGMVRQDRAERVAATLLGEPMFSGFGIRTLAMGEVRYDPMSYHNGSIWPHDNALIALGLARYGLKDEVCKVLNGFFEASTFADLNRLPELFCGFRRRRGEGPTRYPVACSPQAWAAASVFALLQSSLGLHVDARRMRVGLRRPMLPEYLDEVHIQNLEVRPGTTVDLVLRRHRGDVGLNVVRRTGPLDIVIVK